VDHGYLFASQTRGDLKRGFRVRVRYLYQVSMSMTHGIPCGHDRARCSSGHDGKRELKAGVKRQSRGRARASGHNVKSVVFDAQLTPSVGFCSVSDLGLAGFAVKKRAVGAYYTCDINVLRVKYASPPRGGPNSDGGFRARLLVSQRDWQAAWVGFSLILLKSKITVAHNSEYIKTTMRFRFDMPRLTNINSQ